MTLLQAATGTAYLNDELKAIGLEMMEINVQAGSPLCDQPISEVEVSWRIRDRCHPTTRRPLHSQSQVERSSWRRATSSSSWGIKGRCHNSPARLGARGGQLSRQHAVSHFEPGPLGQRRPPAEPLTEK